MPVALCSPALLHVAYATGYARRFSPVTTVTPDVIVNVPSNEVSVPFVKLSEKCSTNTPGYAPEAAPRKVPAYEETPV